MKNLSDQEPKLGKIEQIIKKFFDQREELDRVTSIAKEYEAALIGSQEDYEELHEALKAALEALKLSREDYKLALEEIERLKKKDLK